MRAVIVFFIITPAKKSFELGRQKGTFPVLLSLLDFLDCRV